MNLDEALRHTLTDEHRALPAWPDAIDRVHAGVRRRRYRRLAVTVVAVAVAALLAVPALVNAGHQTALPPSAPGTPSAGAAAVPFRHTPGVLPSPAASVPRPISSPCTATDLADDASVVGEEGAGAHHWVIAVRIVGGRQCTLTGWPGLSVGDTSVRTVQMRFSNDLLAVPGETPATVEPGQRVLVRIINKGSCDSGLHPATADVGLTFALLYDGKRIPVSGPFWPYSCDIVSMSQWYRPFDGAAGGQGLGGAGVTAQLSAPTRVANGAALDYVVTLTNPGSAPVSLAPCPVFRQDFATTGELLQLNCAAAPAVIPARGSVRFAMSIPVDTLGKTGPAVLHWQIEEAGGPTAGADVSVEVTP
jgi:hypothetical protein